jgi:hypothetical protein
LFFTYCFVWLGLFVLVAGLLSWLGVWLAFLACGLVVAVWLFWLCVVAGLALGFVLVPALLLLSFALAGVFWLLACFAVFRLALVVGLFYFLRFGGVGSVWRLWCGSSSSVLAVCWLGGRDGWRFVRLGDCLGVRDVVVMAFWWLFDVRVFVGF